MATSSNLQEATSSNPLGSGLTNLTLAKGMTADYYGVPDPNTGGVRNPPIMSSNVSAALNPYGGRPNWQPLRIGVMRNTPGALPSGKVYSLYFIFNPNQIGVSFATDPNQLPPAYLYGQDAGTASDVGSTGVFVGSGQSQSSQIASQASGGTSSTAPAVANLTQNQTISWSLLFDRTYDMLYARNPGNNRGVLQDVAALYGLMGTYESTGAVPVSTPVDVVFGVTENGAIFGFTGYITGFNLTYGIFKWNMIPSHAEVDLSMMLTYVFSTPSQSQASASGAQSSVVTNGVSAVTAPPSNLFNNTGQASVVNNSPTAPPNHLFG